MGIQKEHNTAHKTNIQREFNSSLSGQELSISNNKEEETVRK